MAHPKRKFSKARTRKRRTHQKVNMPALIRCSQCRRLKPIHMVCPFCGYYRDREVIKVLKPKKEKKG